MFLTAQMEGPWVACAAVHVVWQVVCAAKGGKGGGHAVPFLCSFLGGFAPELRVRLS